MHNKTQPIYYSYYHSPVGRLLMLAKENKLTNLDFETEQIAPNPKWVLKDELPLFEQVKTALTAYFNGEKPDFDALPLAPEGTPFQCSVWQALRQIGYGESGNYAQLAQAIGRPKAVRAVGGAVGSNPISIIIPCHRILGKSGQLTGFGGGLPVKRRLLQLEGILYVDKGVEYVKQKLLKKYRA
ncbi:methylated-DNA-[protein]-cysteine S-methyltransferase [Mesocricetibacter intestinalis]|uniref:Methylated-DNA--protein-cysteine methyltransferase n=1 Tax=Mesocricetibacter intestinalis TaxID=1521930 RepID=A0A4V3D9M9_9PAST|nr:methylated-DNA--[protein]-cysteine S-methyltransferase [Mesocricetibacter intestinalis]TDQ57947.1 methylated-DNA-[protein]-cysteine S-methyltransferase [Mesocricetibacter intestinalis]